MTTLYLYLQDFASRDGEDEASYTGTVSWLIEGDDDIGTMEGECDLSELKAQLDDKKDQARFNSTVLFLEDSCTLFVREKIPGKTVPQIRRALPFAVENYLSHALEETHIAHGTISRSNAIDCVAIESALLEKILQALKIYEVFPTVCTTIGMQIPRPDAAHDIHVLKDDHNAWIRTADHLALVNVDVLADVVGTLSGHREPVPTIREWSFGADDSQYFDPSMYEHEVIGRQGLSLISFAVEQFDVGTCLNLLQGKYSAKEHATADLRRWIMTGVFALICLYGYIAIQAAEGIWATFKVNEVQTQLKTQFVEIYDEQPRGQDIVREMRTRLGVSGDTTRAFDLLLERLATVMSSAAHSPTINSIKYESSRQKLDIAYTISNHEAMEAFVRALGNNTITVDRGPAETREQSVRANVTISIRQ